MNSIINEVIKINLFGRDLQFEKDFSSRYNSCPSFILTLLVLISTIIVSFLFGQEIYMRKNPKSSQSIKIISDEETEIPLSNFPLIFSFSTSLGMNILDSDLLKILRINPIEMIYDRQNITRVVHSFQICDINSFENNDKNKHIINAIESGKANNETFYCFNQTLNPKFKGIKSNPISSMLYLNIQRCRQNCKQDFKTIIEGMYLKYVYVNSFIDPKNYTNPVNYFTEPQLIKLSDSISKDITHSFSKSILQTNKGWIFDNKKDEFFITSKKSVTEFFFSTTTLATVYFDSPNNVDILFREYMKLQDLLANIGGFFNALVIVLSILFSHYLKFDYYMFIDSKINSKSLVIESNKRGEENVNPVNNILKNNFLRTRQVNNEDENADAVENEKQVENKNVNENNSNRSNNNRNKLNEENKNESKNKIKVRVNRRGNNPEEKNFNSHDFSQQKININNNILKEATTDTTKNLSLYEGFTEYYISYLYYNYCCCNSYNTKRIDKVQQILSFENYIDISLSLSKENNVQ